MSEFALDYSILVFLASIGVIQIAASVNRLKGLLFFKSPLMARLFGLSLTVGAFVWFFASEPRNINDYAGGLDANVQALFCFFSAVAAVLATFVVSSLLNARMGGEEHSPDDGLDALRSTTYLKAVTSNLARWWREWRTQMRSYFSG